MTRIVEFTTGPWVDAIKQALLADQRLHVGYSGRMSDYAEAVEALNDRLHQVCSDMHRAALVGAGLELVGDVTGVLQ